MTRQCLRGMLEDPVAMTNCHNLDQQERDDNMMITWQGVQVKKTDTDIANFQSTKSLFINELLSNLDRRFPDEGMELCVRLIHWDVHISKFLPTCNSLDLKL